VSLSNLTERIDLLGVDALLNEEERAIQGTVRRFLNERISPQIAEWYEQGHLPLEIASELGALGLLGMHLEGYGCAGAGAVSYGVACLELEAVDSGLRSFVSVQGSLAMNAIFSFGSDEQKERWLPPMAKGQAIGCFALTESAGGSDPANMTTWARRDGEDWVINGSKLWITNGSTATVAVVWAQTDVGIRGFLVPRDTLGFQAIDIPRKLSLRASVTSELVFSDCRVPGDALLPGSTGLRSPLSCLSEARYGILWGVVGAARTCLLTALDYSLTREIFDKPVAAFQLTQKKLADMAVELGKAHLVALHLGRRKELGQLQPAQVSFGKLNNVREALAIARDARTILGANGITLDFAVMRHMQNLESVLTYEGTSEIHTLVLGQALTGIPAYR
jgi:glutaryl-CoA dehydrogenase